MRPKNPRNNIAGITFSTFDFFHAGHVKILEEAKSICDYPILGLQLHPSIDRKEKNKPVQSVIERYIEISSCKFVDEAVPYVTEKDLDEILRSFKINIRIIGEEHKDKSFTGKDYCEANGIQLYYNSCDHEFSSSNIRKKLSKEN